MNRCGVSFIARVGGQAVSDVQDCAVIYASDLAKRVMNLAGGFGKYLSAILENVLLPHAVKIFLLLQFIIKFRWKHLPKCIPIITTQPYSLRFSPYFYI